MFIFFSVHAFLLTAVGTGHANTTNQGQRANVIHRFEKNSDNNPEIKNDHIIKQTKELVILLNKYMEQLFIIRESINECLTKIGRAEKTIEKGQKSIISSIKRYIPLHTIKQAQLSWKQLIVHGPYSLLGLVHSNNTNVHLNVCKWMGLVDLVYVVYNAMPIALDHFFYGYEHPGLSNSTKLLTGIHLMAIYMSISVRYDGQQTTITFRDSDICNLKQVFINFLQLLDELMLERVMVDHLIGLMKNDDATDAQFYECFGRSRRACILMDMIRHSEEMAVHISMR